MVFVCARIVVQYDVSGGCLCLERKGSSEGGEVRRGENEPNALFTKNDEFQFCLSLLLINGS